MKKALYFALVLVAFAATACNDICDRIQAGPSFDGEFVKAPHYVDTDGYIGR
jgi:hypothetical protein